MADVGWGPMGYTPVPLSQRRPRKPVHTFQITQRPWVIQPFCCAPVIAGETLQNAFLQARVVSDPIKDPLTGWWLEYFLWYVKLRDIEFIQGGGSSGGPPVVSHPWVEQMLLDPTWDFTTSTGYTAAARPQTFKAANSIDWPYLCLQRVIETYFRLDGESLSAGSIGTELSCSIGEDEQPNMGFNWMNSLVDESAVTWDTGFNVDLNADTTITTAEIDQAMRTWRFQTMAGQTSLSFQDYLAQFGIQIPTDDLHRPELLRFLRLWQYPSNTVDPTTGSPSSALSWSVAERADKDRFFSEPGFIFGASIVRPKVYMTKQTDAAVQMLTNAFAWMPQVFQANPESSWKRFEGGATPTGKGRGPLGPNATNGYWVDLKDLYLYGDHFHNKTTLDSAVALPTATLQKRFAIAADADALFKSATVNKVRTDGVLNLNILGTQVETSPQGQRYS